MPADSKPEKSPAAVIGLVASVIGISAFFGISNWEELTDFIASGGSGNSSSGSIDEAQTGDCNN